MDAIGLDKLDHKRLQDVLAHAQVSFYRHRSFLAIYNCWFCTCRYLRESYKPDKPDSKPFCPYGDHWSVPHR